MRGSHFFYLQIVMSDTDTESSDETDIQTYKCHICQYKPNFTTLAHILQQIIDIGPYLITLPNGQFYVRCQFEDCERYYHLWCIHPTFPDEGMNFEHFEDLRQNGIHCPKCEPGVNIINY